MSEARSGLNRDCVGTVSSPTRRSWTATDSVIYALGVGAGPDELAFATDDTRGVEPRAVPTMAVVLALPSREIALAMGDYDRSKLVHGSQTTIVYRPIPVAGEVEYATTITGVYDKGSGAAVETETIATDLADGEAVFVNRSVAFIRGEGGWGGDRGPASVIPKPPEREPDRRITYDLAANQALIYRLSGDRNPLHSDPTYARRAGFDKPILHGLCTYGFVGRALIEYACDGNPDGLRAMTARFVAPMYPGDSLTVSMWRVDDDHTVFTGHRDGDQLVISGGLGERFV